MKVSVENPFQYFFGIRILVLGLGVSLKGNVSSICGVFKWVFLSRNENRRRICLLVVHILFQAFLYNQFFIVDF